ncbi:thioredoxin family protein [Vibrio breoganii]|uniref:Redox-active disulfide protein 2 n=1 Tax=Vibrio breoganii TaxID=553239 RepID=A0AAP8SWG2_9VIBR|nr:thioredoxin family protein [Vibrio breoganii]PMH19581.1 redox-active disulfide protein 2 [Vibrio breoganii]PMM16087.1 redox-active disulfide protein 2 [Vibrio breoganii]PMP05640.1 redox-active disulfide protein 2 [Vibrio breoganii]PMP09866.1 redox-active disulfide protein 2 [Vibrio breoganii]TKG19337.1 thioredoxin family protein [Vibrio breoganii]
MKHIQVYGTGCKGCTVTADRIEQVAQELGQNITLEKVTSLEDIMQAGVLSTPGIGIDGVIKHTGSVPSVEQIRDLFA